MNEQKIISELREWLEKERDRLYGIAAFRIKYNSEITRLNDFEEVIDKLTELEQKYCKEPESEWISVDDRLPEENEAVYCFGKQKDGYKIFGIFSLYTNRWNPDVDYVSGRDYELTTFYLKDKEITHWMPLPKEPQAEGEK